MKNTIASITLTMLLTSPLTGLRAEDTPTPAPGKQVEQSFQTSDGASVGYLLYLPKDHDPA